MWYLIVGVLCLVGFSEAQSCGTDVVIMVDGGKRDDELLDFRKLYAAQVVTNLDLDEGSDRVSVLFTGGSKNLHVNSLLSRDSTRRKVLNDLWGLQLGNGDADTEKSIELTKTILLGRRPGFPVMIIVLSDRRFNSEIEAALEEADLFGNVDIFVVRIDGNRKRESNSDQITYLFGSESVSEILDRIPRCSAPRSSFKLQTGAIVNEGWGASAPVDNSGYGVPAPVNNGYGAPSPVPCPAPQPCPVVPPPIQCPPPVTCAPCDAPTPPPSPPPTARPTTQRRTTPRPISRTTPQPPPRSTTPRVTPPPARSTTTLPPTTTLESGKCFLDLMFIIDASQSVEEIFRLELEDAAAVVDRLVLGETNARVALIRFSSTIKARTIFSFNRYTEKETIKRAILSTKYTSGTTDIRRALELAAEEFTPAKGARPNAAQQVCVIFTDGNSWKDPRPAAKTLLDQGVTVFAVGLVGEGGPGFTINEGELAVIAGTPERVYTDATFAQFQQKLNEITEICL